MRRAAGQRLLRLLGILTAAAGGLAWVGLAWEGAKNLDQVSAHSEEGAQLLGWGLTGTLLMIAGIVILHTVAIEEEDDGEGEGGE